jgi:hypothetical protein
VYDLLTLLLSEVPLHLANLSAHLAPGAVGKKAFRYRELVSFDTMYPTLHQPTWSWQHARFAAGSTTVAACLAQLSVRHDGTLEVLAHHAARNLWVYSPRQLATILAALAHLGVTGPGVAVGESPAVQAFVGGAVQALEGAPLPPHLRAHLGALASPGPPLHPALPWGLPGEKA